MLCYTLHSELVMRERGIRPEWVAWVVETASVVEHREDGTNHFLGQLPDFESRWLRVVTTDREGDIIVVTAFFDRRVTRRERER